MDVQHGQLTGEKPLPHQVSPRLPAGRPGQRTRRDEQHGVGADAVPASEHGPDGLRDRREVGADLVADLLTDDHRLVPVGRHAEHHRRPGPQAGVTGRHVDFEVLGVQVPSTVNDEVLAATLDEQLTVENEAEIAGTHVRRGRLAGQGESERGRGRRRVAPVSGAAAVPGHDDLTRRPVVDDVYSGRVDHADRGVPRQGIGNELADR